jgi:oligosaccharide 4-alpha-D-glucosyltransferase
MKVRSWLDNMKVTYVLVAICSLAFLSGSIHAEPSGANASNSENAASSSTKSLFSQLSKSYLSHRLDNQTLTITHSRGDLTIAALTPFAFEVKPSGNPLIRDDFPSFSKSPSLSKLTDATKVKLINTKTSIALATDQMVAQVDKKTMQISYFLHDQLVVAEERGFYANYASQGFRFKLAPDEKLMGAGQRVLGMDRRGHRLPLYNRAHYDYGTVSTQMNFSLPAVMSTKKYVILYDNPAKGFIDLGKSEPNVLKFEAQGGRQAYIVMAADTFPELIHQYVNVTGKQPLPPRWALANHASRFGYRTQDEVVSTIQKYRELDVPVDSIILDLYWFGKDIQGHMGNLDWDKAAFPAPQKMLKDLNDLQVKTTLITEPFILKDSGKWQSALASDVLAMNSSGERVRTYDFYFGHTGLIDVFHEPAVNWLDSLYQDLAKQGVTGVWGDLGEPEVHPSDMLHRITTEGRSILATADEVHNAYGHQWAKIVQDSMAEAMPNQRPFILMRSGFAGSQRYGMLPWTGDVGRKWEGLQPQPELTMQMSLFGLGYTHSDLGGFAGGEQFDQEMYIRWLQYGVFQPIYRPHAQDNIAPEPVFHDPKTLSIVREYIKLRYRLMPYNYTLAYENSTTGMPLMRPMLFEDEANTEWLSIADQFFWGDAFLVKLIAEPGITETNLTLPQGRWTNFWTNEQINVNEKEASVSVPVTLEQLPVFVRGGSIIPSVGNYASEADYQTDKLNLAIYFDPQVTVKQAQMYNDDGISSDALSSGAYELLSFNGAATKINKQSHYALRLGRELPNPVAFTEAPTERAMQVSLHHWPHRPIGIKFQDQPLAQLLSRTEFDLEQTGAFYDEKKQILHVKFVWRHDDAELNIK